MSKQPDPQTTINSLEELSDERTRATTSVDKQCPYCGVSYSHSLDCKRAKIEKILEKLANPKFNWSRDCSHLMAYDEWVVSRAQKALDQLGKP